MTWGHGEGTAVVLGVLVMLLGFAAAAYRDTLLASSPWRVSLTLWTRLLLIVGVLVIAAGVLWGAVS